MNNFNEKLDFELLSHQDKEYQKFHKSLGVGLNPNVEVIGIKMNIIKDITKKLKKTYDLEFLLNNIDENYHEKILIKGSLIGYYKDLSYCELEKYIRYYVPKITDWSLCDSFCSNLKITKKYLKELFPLLKMYLNSENEFDVRFSLVMLLNYYLIDDYIDDIFKMINKVSLDKYYVKMANAWLISYCFIKYYDKTCLFYQKEISIDKWTHNKGIQKAIESYRLTKEQKLELKKLKYIIRR